MKKKIIVLAATAIIMAVALAGCGVKITNIAVPESAMVEKGESITLPVVYGTDDAPAVTPETAATGESAETDEKLAKAASKLTVEWTSSDESVATVDATGMVVAVSAGEADITASVMDSEMSAVCRVTVKVAAKDITVPDNLDVKLNDGNETTVEATVSPADATDVKVSYASTDEAVATVDKDGRVQVLQPGECDIVTTLTQEDKKVVEKKTHIKAYYEVEGITLDKTEGILTAGNTVALNATVLPEEIADETTVTWTSSDEKVATVDENGKVTAIAAGEATITANAGEKSATYKLTVQAKKVAQTTTNKNTNKGNTSSSTGSSAPTSNPAPAQPSAPAEQPSQPTYEEPAQPAPNPQPEQPSNGDNGGSGNSGDKYGEGYDRWAAPLIQHRLIMHVLLKAIVSNFSLLYRNYYQLKYSWNFLKKVKWLSDIRQPFFDLLR